MSYTPNPNYKTASIFIASILLVGAPLQAEVISLFADAGDEVAFSDVGVPLSAPPEVLEGSGAGILESSPIDSGSAILMWDLDDAGRTDFRYERGVPFQNLVMYNFDAVIESGSTGGNSIVFRIGDAGPLSSISNTAMAISLQHNGEVRYEYNDENQARVGESHAVGLDTPFQCTMVFNATESAETYDSPAGSRSLEPGHFDLYVDEELVASDLPALSGYTGAGITRLWIMTGSGTAAVAPSVIFDNISVRTDADVSLPIVAAEKFWGLTVLDGGLIDTGRLLGWLYVSEAPWIFSYTLEKWIYSSVPGDELVDGQTWFYFTL